MDPTKAATKPDAPRKGAMDLVSSLHGSIWGRYLLCLLLAGVLVTGKKYLLEPLSVYETNRLWTYDLIQKVLALGSSVDTPVAVVNIADIDKEPSNNLSPSDDPAEQKAVSRQALLNIFERLAPAKPKAIAVDVDISAGLKGNPTSVQDPEFLQHCREFESKHGIPIFLGVDRHAADTEDKWLGVGYSGMAVGLGIGNDLYQGKSAEMETRLDSVLRMFCWTQVDGVPTRLRSLAYGAGKVARPEAAELGPLLSWAIEAESNFNPARSLKTRGFLVDYRLIDTLDRSRISSKSLKQPVEADDKRFHGKVVLLGAVRTETDDGRPLKRTDDLFRIPGHSSLYSGVLLHGCAVDTLVRAPLRQWTPAGRIAADFGLTLLANSLIELLIWAFSREKHPHKHVFKIFWSVTALTILVLGLVVIPFVGTIRLVWDDAIIVAAALILHTGIDHWLVRAVHRREHHNHEKPAPKPEPEPEPQPSGDLKE